MAEQSSTSATPITQIRAELEAATPGRLTGMGYQPNTVDDAARLRLFDNFPTYLAALLDVAEAAQDEHAKHQLPRAPRGVAEYYATRCAVCIALGKIPQVCAEDEL